MVGGVMTIHLKGKDKVLVMSHRPCVIRSPTLWADYVVFGCPVPSDRLTHCIVVISLGCDFYFAVLV